MNSVPFSDTITEFWKSPFIGQQLYEDEHLTIIANPGLVRFNRVTILWTVNPDRWQIAIHPDIADRIKLAEAIGPGFTVGQFRALLAGAGIQLNGADRLHYLPIETQKTLLMEPVSSDIAKLDVSDQARFSTFEASATEQDLDDAQVDLDDWVAHGVSDSDGRLVSVGSMYPWRGAYAEQTESRLADIGVLTLVDARGKGFGKRLVRAMAQYAIDKDYAPQYRCQIDNPASIALAAATGFSLFGTWEAVLSEEEG